MRGCVRRQTLTYVRIGGWGVPHRERVLDRPHSRASSAQTGKMSHSSVERNHAGDGVSNRWSVEQPQRERARDRDYAEYGD
jgi:hypothetical protein